MLGLIVSLLIIGLIAGALARLVVPGRQDMSIVMTIVLGVIGSFIGGFLGYLLFHKDGQDGFSNRGASSAVSAAPGVIRYGPERTSKPEMPTHRYPANFRTGRWAGS